MAYNTTHSEFQEELERVAEIVERIPRSTDMDKHGKFCCGTYTRKYGSWDEALEACGFEAIKPNRPCQSSYTAAELVRYLRKFENQHGRVPTTKDALEWEGPSRQVYYDEFGDWNQALQAAGLTPQWGTPGENYGEKNPAWVGGHKHRYGCNWDEQREKALERDNYKCRACGMTQEEHKERYNRSLIIHHVVPLRKFDDPLDANSLGNLVTACTVCHNQFEGLPVFPL